MLKHLALCLGIALVTPLAHAGPAKTKKKKRVAASASATAEPATGEKAKPWIKRYAPQRHMGEVGMYYGIFLPSRDHEFFEPDNGLAEQGYRDLRSVMGDLGLRGGYFPLRFFGVELEAGLMPGHTSDIVRATMWHVRGHAVGQLGLWRITPFVVAGVSALGVRSTRNALGNDVDVGFHFGAGVKFFINRYLALRLDLRDTIAARRGVDNSVTNNGEVLFGFSITLGRKKPTKPASPSDRDRDGFIDDEDKCPDDPGFAPDGCPIRDSDEDGFLDPDDKCPDEPGVAPDGCPVGDRDGDGFLDPDDRCVEVPGGPPDGCPVADRDGDGIVDDVDKCPDDPETKNGFQDEDGCPDELPKAVEAFSGVIEGIFFELDKARIRPRSRRTLNKAVKVLTDFPSVNLEIVGHTDGTGSREHNVDLSQRRAEAVKTYLVDHGIDAGRLKTRGAGADVPIADNKTQRGRAKNRRIEFKIMEE